MPNLFHGVQLTPPPKYCVDNKTTLKAEAKEADQLRIWVLKKNMVVISLSFHIAWSPQLRAREASNLETSSSRHRKESRKMRSTFFSQRISKGQHAGQNFLDNSRLLQSFCKNTCSPSPTCE
jgi:hypothetical protein